MQDPHNKESKREQERPRDEEAEESSRSVRKEEVPLSVHDSTVSDCIYSQT